MKKYLFLLALITLTFFSEISAQDECECLSGGITFSTQGQINSFQISYSECTKILGDVLIMGVDIINLDGLDTLEEVGALTIKNNPNLVSLSGLNNLKKVNNCPGLLIENNDALENLEGFDSLSSIKDELLIRHNDGLINLEGLENLDSIFTCLPCFEPPCPNGYLTIESNDSLENLIGLEGLKYISHGYISISNNDNLTSLEGLPGFDYLYQITINHNDLLDNLEGIPNVDYLENLIIENNDLLSDLESLQNIVSLDNLTVENQNSIINLEWMPDYSSLSSLTIKDNDFLDNLGGIQNIGSISNLTISHNDILGSFGASGSIPIDSSAVKITISDNGQLTSIEGLHGMEYVSELIISNNDSLVSLNGLQSLKAVKIIGCCHWQCNPYISSCIGRGFVEIINNDKLVDLSGLDNLQKISLRLDISDNKKLLSLSGLNSLCEIEGKWGIPKGLILEGNDLLTECASQVICNLLPDISLIGNNSSGCNSVEEIEPLCAAIPPAIPILISPLDGTIDEFINTTLTWAPYAFTNTYTVQISTEPGFSSIIEEIMDITVDTLVTPQLNSSTTYFWRMKAFNSAGESDWSEIWSYTTGVETDIKEIAKYSPIKLYPNPAFDKLNLQFSDPTLKDKLIEVSLFDTQGRMISKQFISDGQTIEMGVLPPGMYLLKAVDDEKIYTGKFVKQ